VWRSDLDPAVKSRLYFWIMNYGRHGTPDEVAAARKVLAGLQWAPLRPSSNAQLYPIRQLELNKQLLKVRSDTKMGEAERQSKVDALRKEIDKIAVLVGKVPSM
jgi:phosphonate transport system substrate-binding protein